jgi:hypothetical protein
LLQICRKVSLFPDKTTAAPAPVNIIYKDSYIEACWERQRQLILPAMTAIAIDMFCGMGKNA